MASTLFGTTVQSASQAAMQQAAEFYALRQQHEELRKAALRYLPRKAAVPVMILLDPLAVEEEGGDGEHCRAIVVSNENVVWMVVGDDSPHGTPSKVGRCDGLTLTGAMPLSRWNQAYCPAFQPRLDSRGWPRRGEESWHPATNLRFFLIGNLADAALTEWAKAGGKLPEDAEAGVPALRRRESDGRLEWVFSGLLGQYYQEETGSFIFPPIAVLRPYVPGQACFAGLPLEDSYASLVPPAAELPAALVAGEPAADLQPPVAAFVPPEAGQS